MSCYAMIFSPCGGTERIVHAFCKEWKEEVIEIDLSNPDCTGKNTPLCEKDICIIAMPSYGGRAPEAALQRLQAIQGNHAAAILICSYGNRAYEDTLLEMKESAQACGFVCRAAVAAVAEHSIMHVYGTARPDAQDQKELAAFGCAVKEHLKNEIDSGTQLFVPGNHPYKSYGGVPLKPLTDKRCTSCGLCAAKCPVQAISKEHPNKTDTDTCISCMRCIAICPMHARSLHKLLLAASVKKLKKACETRKNNDLFL